VSVSLSRGNILPLMANQYFSEGISVIRGTQVQKVRLDVCGSIPSRFFSSSSGNTFAPSGKSILLNFRFQYCFYSCILASLSALILCIVS